MAKPAGPTSHDVVALVRRLAETRRVGHGGTLDPFASGVLPVFLGRATRLVEYHLGDAKRYRATVCFGASTTTDDLEGERTPVDAPAPDRAAVEAALPTFLGEHEQRPPAYSAVKVAGRRAYALARAGETPSLSPRRVRIDALTLLEWDDSDPTRPVAVIDVACGAGTYVRALARDLGEAVGNAAYLGALARTASGPFELGDAVSLDALRTAALDGQTGVARLLRPIDAGLEDMGSVQLPAAEADRIVLGQTVKLPPGLESTEAPVRVVDSGGRLVAIARVRGSTLAPDKVLVDRPATSEPAHA